MMTPRPFATLVASAAPLALPLAAFAQEPVLLPEIVVSGGLTPIAAPSYGRAYSVVTAEDLERRQTVYVADALRALPGVSVNRSGGAGGITQVRIRGAEGSHTLVLIDGVEANATENGEYDFGGLLATDIERIEVLRGPQSSLYGSNAIGGVISITTKKGPAANGFDVGGGTEGGTDGTYAGDIFVRGRGTAGTFSVSVAGRHDGGYDISNDPNGSDDTARNLSVNASGSLFMTEWLTLGATVRHTDRENDYDGFLFGAPTAARLVYDEDDVHARQETAASLFADIRTFGGRMVHRADATWLTADDQNFSDGIANADTTGDRLKLGWQSTLALDAATVDAADHLLTLAADYTYESYRNNDPAIVYDPSQLETQSRRLFGLVGEYRGSFFDALDLQLGVRHDFNDDFADATTWSAGVAYRLADYGTRFHASAGTGVQNPTLYEQFGFIPGEFVGNPDLKPEKSFGWDVGVEQLFWGDRAAVDVTWFQQNLKDEIFTAYPAPSYIGTPVNEDGESDRQGIEVTARVRPVDPLTMGLSYTWLDATDFDGSREIRRPQHEFGFDATYAFLGGRASVTLDGRVVLDNLDSDFRSPAFGTTKVTLDDYVVLNIAAQYQATENVQVYARVQNLLDADYEEQFGYPAQGVVAFAGVRARF